MRIGPSADSPFAPPTESGQSLQALEQALHEAKEALAAQLTAKVSPAPCGPVRLVRQRSPSTARRVAQEASERQLGAARAEAAAVRDELQRTRDQLRQVCHVPMSSVATCPCRPLFGVHGELRRLGHGSQP